MKLNLTIIICFFLASNIFAQSKWSWGIQTEIGISGAKEFETDFSANRTGTTEYTSTNFRKQKPAIGGGLWVNYQLNNWLGLNSGLLYINAGEENGYKNSSILQTTKQQMSYADQSNSFRVHRLQIPLSLDVQLSKKGLKPSIGAGVVWSEDYVTSVEEKTLDFTTSLYEIQEPFAFPSHIRMGGLQLMASFGVELSDQLSVEFKHLFARKTKNIEWTIDHGYDVTPGVIVCFIGPSHEYIETRYQQMSSLVFKYRFSTKKI